MICSHCQSAIRQVLAGTARPGKLGISGPWAWTSIARSAVSMPWRVLESGVTSLLAHLLPLQLHAPSGRFVSTSPGEFGNMAGPMLLILAELFGRSSRLQTPILEAWLVQWSPLISIASVSVEKDFGRYLCGPCSALKARASWAALGRLY